MQPSFQNPYLLMTTPLSLNSGRYDAVIVDLDGTLVDTLGDFVAALRLMLADVLPPEYAGVTLDVADVGSRVGKGSEHLVQSVLNHVFAQAGRAQTAIDSVAYYERAQASYQRHYAALNGQHAALYPGVPEGLQKLQKSGLRMVCLTNKPLAFARSLLQLKGLDGFFVEVFGGDSFARKKPDPLPLIKAC